MEKYAWRAKLYDGKKKEYIKRHNEIWNEMLQVLNDAGIKNYSIWIDGSDVFGYYECEKGMPGKNNTNHGLTTFRQGLFYSCPT